MPADHLKTPPRLWICEGLEGRVRHTEVPAIIMANSEDEAYALLKAMLAEAKIREQDVLLVELNISIPFARILGA